MFKPKQKGCLLGVVMGVEISTPCAKCWSNAIVWGCYDERVTKKQQVEEAVR